MKHLFLALSVILGVWMLSPVPEAEAGRRGRGSQQRSHHSSRGSHSHNGVSVPELGSTTAGGAMVLLLGGVALIASRRRDDDFA